MKKIVLGLFVASLALLSSVAIAQDEAPKQTLFTNVNVFDGKSEFLRMGVDVLVEGNVIKSISEDSIGAPAATVITGDGRTLMPGLIDNHVHLMLNGAGLLDIEANMTWEDLAIGGVAMAELYLNEGFTTVRDMGGANGGLTRAIKAGTIVGPRVYPSGAFIGGRGGHADFALYTSRAGGDTNMSRLNISHEANGADAVMQVARNNFRQGASQIKIMQTGGVAWLFDPVAAQWHDGRRDQGGGTNSGRLSKLCRCSLVLERRDYARIGTGCENN